MSCRGVDRDDKVEIFYQREKLIKGCLSCKVKDVFLVVHALCDFVDLSDFICETGKDDGCVIL